MQLLCSKGDEVNTLLLPEETFYIGEAYHQYYYEKQVVSLIAICEQRSSEK